MADDKGKPVGRSVSTELTYLLVGLFLLSILLARFENYISQGNLRQVSVVGLWAGSFFTSYIAPVLKLMSLVATAAALYGIFKVTSLFNALNESEKELYGSKVKVGESDDLPEVKNGKWERIIELVNSTNASDWRLAIIEADVMLEDLLRRMGYHGESIGEMLKGIEESDFLTLDAAWEAHKVRNRIAHSGSEFPLNEREAKRVIALFESVFREFKII
jgi:hypothetical protein